MSYVAPNPEADEGEVIGDGQCVAFVKASAGCPQTALWAEGRNAKGANLARGTAIATFQNGKYNNYTDGRSHAAIYISQDDKGLTVYDQWVGRPVQKRVIRFKNGNDDPSNDGDAFCVIETTSVMKRLVRIAARREGTESKKILSKRAKAPDDK